MSDAPSADDLLSDGGTSARADSDAANDAFDAAVVSQSLAADAADVFVRGRLVECGIVGDAATSLMATSIADLRAVAVEVLGGEFSELQWAALHRIWIDAEFGGRREVLDVTRSLFNADGSPIVRVAPPDVVGPAVVAAAAAAAAAAAPPRLYVPSDAATAALAATTHVFLAASSTQKRGHPTTVGKIETPLPPMVPGMTGHKAVADKWEKGYWDVPQLSTGYGW